MIRRMRGLLLPLAWLLLAGPPLALGAEAAQVEGEGSATRVLGEDTFAAGERVRVSQDNPGDAIAAGSKLDFTGRIGGDAVAAGRDLTIGSAIDGDLYAAAAELRIDGTVAGNARVVGRSVELGPRGEVSGGMSAAGQEVEIEGRVGSYLQVAAAETRIDGQVGGDVEVRGRELTIGPGAVIDGTVTFRGRAAPVVAAGAQVRGGVRHLQPDPAAEAVPQGMRTAFGVGALLWLAGWLVAGSVLIALRPQFARALTRAVRTRPGLSTLGGLLLLIGVPVLIAVLMATLVGIPLGLLLLAAYLLWLPLGYLTGAAALGEGVLQRLHRGRESRVGERILAFAVVLIVLFLLLRVPVAGKLIATLVLLAGMGSLVVALLGRRGAGAEAST